MNKKFTNTAANLLGTFFETANSFTTSRVISICQINIVRFLGRNPFTKQQFVTNCYPLQTVHPSSYTSNIYQFCATILSKVISVKVIFCQVPCLTHILHLFFSQTFAEQFFFGLNFLLKMSKFDLLFFVDLENNLPLQIIHPQVNYGSSWVFTS